MDMFKEWGFLLGEIWVLIQLALLLGLLAGWLIWGRGAEAQTEEATHDATVLNVDRTTCRAKLPDSETVATRATKGIVELEQAGDSQKAWAAPESAALAPDAAPATRMRRPQALDGPRDGTPNDLKLIKGIGPQMEDMCNKLGFFHFDQIAAWTEAEIAWVDENLEGFKGRVTRDEWVSQARVLADGELQSQVAAKSF